MSVKKLNESEPTEDMSKRLLVVKSIDFPAVVNNYKQDKIQMRFLKYTAQQMRFKLIDTNNKMLCDFLVNAKDRQYLPMSRGIRKEIH